MELSPISCYGFAISEFLPSDGDDLSFRAIDILAYPHLVDGTREGLGTARLD